MQICWNELSTIANLVTLVANYKSSSIRRLQQLKSFAFLILQKPDPVSPRPRRGSHPLALSSLCPLCSLFHPLRGRQAGERSLDPNVWAGNSNFVFSKNRYLKGPSLLPSFQQLRNNNKLGWSCSYMWPFSHYICRRPPPPPQPSGHSLCTISPRTEASCEQHHTWWQPL